MKQTNNAPLSEMEQARKQADRKARKQADGEARACEVALKQGRDLAREVQNSTPDYQRLKAEADATAPAKEEIEEAPVGELFMRLAELAFFYLHRDENGVFVVEMFARDRALAQQRLETALDACAVGNAQAIATATAIVQELANFRPVFQQLMPLVRHGKKFPPGRPPGTAGSVRKFVRKRLKTHPTDRAAEIWGALRAESPRGVTVCDNPVGKYIETEGHPDTSYRTFQNIVSDEKRRLKNPK
jgi:hypothetical protein